jgi:hypothetical protein
MSRENIYTQSPKGTMCRLHSQCNVAVEERNQFSTVVPLEPSQAELLATVLSGACYSEPHFAYIIPDEQERHRFLPSFFCGAIRASQSYGEIYITQGVDGGALWIGPGNGLTLRRMMRTGLTSISLQSGWINLRRCMNLAVHLDEVHQRLVSGPHWRLLVLAGEPSKEYATVGGTLIEPLLSRADSDDLPCYLETFNERNLPFYKRHGFRIVGGGKIPRGGPDFWAMIRTPKRTWESRSLF